MRQKALPGSIKMRSALPGTFKIKNAKEEKFGIFSGIQKKNSETGRRDLCILIFIFDDVNPFPYLIVVFLFNI